MGSLNIRFYCCSCDQSHHSANHTHAVLYESYMDISHHWCWRSIPSRTMCEWWGTLHWSIGCFPRMVWRWRCVTNERIIVQDQAGCLLLLQDVCKENQEHDLQVINGRPMSVFCLDTWQHGHVCGLGQWCHGTRTPCASWTGPAQCGKGIHVPARRVIDRICG